MEALRKPHHGEVQFLDLEDLDLTIDLDEILKIHPADDTPRASLSPRMSDLSMTDNPTPSPRASFSTGQTSPVHTLECGPKTSTDTCQTSQKQEAMFIPSYLSCPPRKAIQQSEVKSLSHCDNSKAFLEFGSDVFDFGSLSKAVPIDEIVNEKQQNGVVYHCRLPNTGGIHVSPSSGSGFGARKRRLFNFPPSPSNGLSKASTKRISSFAGLGSRLVSGSKRVGNHLSSPSRGGKKTKMPIIRRMMSFRDRPIEEHPQRDSMGGATLNSTTRDDKKPGCSTCFKSHDPQTPSHKRTRSLNPANVPHFSYPYIQMNPQSPFKPILNLNTNIDSVSHTSRHRSPEKTSQVPKPLSYESYKDSNSQSNNDISMEMSPPNRSGSSSPRPNSYHSTDSESSSLLLSNTVQPKDEGAVDPFSSKIDNIDIDRDNRDNPDDPDDHESIVDNPTAHDSHILESAISSASPISPSSDLDVTMFGLAQEVVFRRPIMVEHVPGSKIAMRTILANGPGSGSGASSSLFPSSPKTEA